MSLARRGRSYDPYMDDYDAQKREEVAMVTSAASDAVVEALTRVAQGGQAVIIQNLHVNVNYASGGGATVRVEGR
jgi:hypothetical protein